LAKLPRWYSHGRAYFKQQIAAHAMPDLHTLPYRTDVLEYLRAAKRAGRTVVLATAADETVANAIAQELGLFDLVLASDGIINLKGDQKRERLVAHFGAGGFDYIGNSHDDIAVWKSARKAFLVSPSHSLAQRVAITTPVKRIFDEQTAGIADYAHAMRAHHWVKNILVFVPLAAAHQLFELDLLLRACYAFAAFCLMASAVYLLNDLLDLPADRKHPNKKDRALASGRISLVSAILLLPILWALAITVAWPLSSNFLLCLIGYYLVMVAYSLGLKDVALMDVLILAGGYALRVAAGALAVNIYPSPWLLSCCVFFFLSLAAVKRYAELVLMQSITNQKTTAARGYFVSDAPMVAIQGMVSGYLTVLLLALYTNSAIAQQLYTHRQLFWVVCVLLMCWINYMWLAAHRGRMHHDPVVFALTDRNSLTLIIAIGLISAFAI
jgi:4-hydroxybenzoate polyprenyltransferase